MTATRGRGKADEAGWGFGERRGWGVVCQWVGVGGMSVLSLQQLELLGGSVAVLVARLLGWLLGGLVGWSEVHAAAEPRQAGDGKEGSEGAGLLLPVHRDVSGIVRWCCHIMLFCSEFTSEEFSSPTTLWFSCLGVRELWMFRESSSLAGAFTGSSSLFWELESSCAEKGGGGGRGGGGGQKAQLEQQHQLAREHGQGSEFIFDQRRSLSLIKHGFGRVCLQDG